MTTANGSAHEGRRGLCAPCKHVFEGNVGVLRTGQGENWCVERCARCPSIRVVRLDVRANGRKQDLDQLAIASDLRRHAVHLFKATQKLLRTLVWEQKEVTDGQGNTDTGYFKSGGASGILIVPSRSIGIFFATNVWSRDKDKKAWQFDVAETVYQYLTP